MGIGTVTKMPMDTCIRTRKIIKCSVFIDSYLHHVYVHAKDYFTKKQSTLPFRGIYVVWIETFICIYESYCFLNSMFILSLENRKITCYPLNSKA